MRLLKTKGVKEGVLVVFLGDLRQQELFCFRYSFVLLLFFE